MQNPENHIAELIFRVNRIEKCLEGYYKIVSPFLESLDGKSVNSKMALVAFDFLERVCYNCRGALYMIDPLRDTKNLLVPLSQIFRALIYDMVMAYWLFEDDKTFPERLMSEDANFIRTNTNKLRESSSEAEIQAIYQGWRNIAPNNFTTNAESISPLKTRKYTFSEICEYVGNTPQSTLIKDLSFAYTALSQQAHVSSFSKRLTYDKFGGSIHFFDLAVRCALSTSSMLLKIIDMPDAYLCQMEIDAELEPLYK
ncbi:hypothetical protein LGH70_19635 [Hymenobacter sp. BT635]|uniref:HEPN AbiU2-like domain-containing protein n=1 Tax=Hymenobacter nitidus TaxID=2880929 RepID=A0ABS8AH97_9BACT|nr:hypothetical protein [Hymenobacter nitidus]MCB2379818.1 hypothetical protein [Hymenobacter nitidus]